MEDKRTLDATINVGDYSNIHVIVEGECSDAKEFNERNMPEIERMFNKYSDVKLKNSDGIYERITTFTGEVLFYDDSNHKYKDEAGNPMISASKYKEKFEKPFPTEALSKKTATNWKCDQEVIKDIWNRNGLMSRQWGNSVHYAMEQYWLYKDVDFDGHEPYLSKNPIIKGAVEAFPEKDRVVLPEVFVSNVKKRFCGQIDGLYITDKKKKTAIIMDYKTDGDMKPAKLRGHFIQLSFYAYILMAFGWTIKKLEIWNYTDKWTKHESDVLDLAKLEKELKEK